MTSFADNKKRLKRSTFNLLTKLYFCLIGFILSNTVFADGHHKLVLVIDDLGYNRPLSEKALQLPGTINFGIIPSSPHAKRLSKLVSERSAQAELLIHMPMESHDVSKLESEALYNSQSREDFSKRINQAIEQFPSAKGLNNHMGSLLTADVEKMGWLMEDLKNHNLYFLDSKTTSKSKADVAAASARLPYIARDVFLDHDRDIESLNAAFNRAVAIANKQGLAILIAHPYPESLDFLASILPSLDSEGIELTTLSDAIAFKNNTRQAGL